MILSQRFETPCIKLHTHHSLHILHCNLPKDCSCKYDMYFDIFEYVFDLVLKKDDEALCAWRQRLIKNTMFLTKKFTYHRLLAPRYLNVVNDLHFIYKYILDEEGTLHSNSKKLKKYIDDQACPVLMPTPPSKPSHEATSSKAKKKPSKSKGKQIKGVNIQILFKLDKIPPI